MRTSGARRRRRVGAVATVCATEDVGASGWILAGRRRLTGIIVTWETSQLLMSWLKALAPANMPCTAPPTHRTHQCRSTEQHPRR